MYQVKWLLGLFSLLFFINTASSQKPKVELAGTEVIKFTSIIDSLPYVLYINLPDNYNKTNKKYPVLYVTDGQWFFASMYVGYGGQHYDGFVPDLITVGITWPDDYTANRGRDFTPNHIDGFPNSGNAAKFLSVIKNEVIKIIDSAYRVDERDRGLYGTSLGGLFAIYTLFHEPALFNRYVIISPALDLDNKIVFKYEKSFAEKNQALNAKIFIGTGQYEEEIFLGKSFDKFVSQLRSHHYKGLELKSQVIGGMSHSGSGTVGGIIGLQYIYSKPFIQLDNAVLEQYTGRYASTHDTSNITRSGTKLYNSWGPAKFQLFAENPQTFFAKGFGVSLEFKKENSKINGYNLILPDTTFFLKKIN